MGIGIFLVGPIFAVIMIIVLVCEQKDKTLMDGEADLVFHDSIGKVLTEADGGKTHESN